MKPTAFLSAFLLSTTTSVALADNKQVQGFIAGGAFIGSDYEGSDDYELNPAVVARIQYEHIYLQTEGLGGKINLSKLDGIEFGPAFNYRMGRDDEVDNLVVAKMAEIDGAFEAGAFVRMQKRNLLAGGDELGFEIKALHDLSDTYDGMTLQAAVDYSYQTTDKLRLTTTLSTTYADDDYMSTYFGVDQNNVGSSGLNDFEASSGIKDIGVSVMANYQLSERWMLTSIVGYTRLLGDAKDSPLVKQEGDADQYMALTGLTYRF